MRKIVEPTVPLSLYEDLLSKYDALVQKVTDKPPPLPYPERSIPEGVLPWVTEEEEDIYDLHLAGRITDDQLAEWTFNAQLEDNLG